MDQNPSMQDTSTAQHAGFTPEGMRSTTSGTFCLFWQQAITVADER